MEPVPAHRQVNQHQKRDRLPADEVLRQAAEPIQAWWRRAYLDGTSPLFPRRFADEARASLPGLGISTTVSSPEVFAAVRVQRLRLRHDQQVPEWAGVADGQRQSWPPEAGGPEGRAESIDSTSKTSNP
jgi:hypothetical protein